LLAGELSAQTLNPTTAEFSPSADHNTTLTGGAAAVSRYDLEFYNAGAASPFQVVSLGKPAPASDGFIRVLLTSVLTALPSPGIIYEARVTAVGPNGVGRSTPSNTFSFSAPCSYAVAPTTQSIVAGGGPASTSVTSAAGCAWIATSNASWLTITSGAAGTGNGTVNYTAAANTATSPRTGTLTVAGQTITVTQAGACNYSISPTAATPAAAGGAATASVTATAGCAWTAASNAPWISITSGASGTGNGTVNYNVAANTATTPRTGTLTIAGRTLTITQSEFCSYSVSSTSVTIAPAGGARSSTVTTTANCSWTAVSNASWITINSGSSGTDDGTVNYTVASNAAAARIGTLTVAGQTITVNQQACSFSLTPTTANISGAGGSASTTVTTQTSCAWTATSNAPWLSITSGASGTGGGSATATATANTAASPRTGTLTVAGSTFTVTQDAACSVSVSPTSVKLPGGGGSANVTVTAGTGCPWSATSGASWATVSGSGSGTGSGTVGISASATTTGRSTTVTIAGQGVTVSQGPSAPASLSIVVD
jgi:hypothetical protein